jgi:hypothetical protein
MFEDVTVGVPQAWSDRWRSNKESLHKKKLRVTDVRTEETTELCSAPLWQGLYWALWVDTYYSPGPSWVSSMNVSYGGVRAATLTTPLYLRGKTTVYQAYITRTTSTVSPPPVPWLVNTGNTTVSLEPRSALPPSEPLIDYRP